MVPSCSYRMYHAPARLPFAPLSTLFTRQRERPPVDPVRLLQLVSLVRWPILHSSWRDGEALIATPFFLTKNSCNATTAVAVGRLLEPGLLPRLFFIFIFVRRSTRWSHATPPADVELGRVGSCIGRRAR